MTRYPAILVETEDRANFSGTVKTNVCINLKLLKLDVIVRTAGDTHLFEYVDRWGDIFSAVQLTRYVFDVEFFDVSGELVDRGSINVGGGRAATVKAPKESDSVVLKLREIEYKVTRIINRGPNNGLYNLVTIENGGVSYPVHFYLVGIATRSPNIRSLQFDSEEVELKVEVVRGARDQWRLDFVRNLLAEKPLKLMTVNADNVNVRVEIYDMYGNLECSDEWTPSGPGDEHLVNCTRDKFEYFASMKFIFSKVETSKPATISLKRAWLTNKYFEI